LDFNDPPKILQDSNKQAWGNSTARNYRLKDEDEALEYINQFKYALDEMFNVMIGKHMRTMSIM
jgi:hypothetical protein